ncbi:MAG: class I SAM-dependent methyltransferase [Methylotenera sp.]|nr:class I SAM-dependent methyltransferase [Methylotenera sp.]
MNTQNWKEIWGRRTHTAEETLDLATLIKLDGFDTGAGRIEAADWQTYAGVIAQKLALKDGDSIYELGCGAGAFLFALRQLHTLKVGGLDYSSALIETATRAMPDGHFIAEEAKSVETETQYDYVISNSVFHYFSYEYAAAVIASMVKKSKVAVAIMEIPDLQTKLEAETLRRDKLSVEAYEKKYAGLEHTYYERDWFKQQAALHGCTSEVFDGCVPNYAQNKFRFGVLIKKA